MSILAYTDETYQHGHHPAVVADHAKRTADTVAAFFLPFIKPGMRLLDVGCGPGTITSGLAQLVEPAETIGIDPSPSVIETAKSLLVAAGQAPDFEVGDIYQTRFARLYLMPFSLIRCCNTCAIQ
jgi:2-polyprenyl-3-methyl-5-hydroxy-6-metoxy-1,4-benzoquinol methylase